jgi:hypothetical protein
MGMNIRQVNKSLRENNYYIVQPVCDGLYFTSIVFRKTRKHPSTCYMSLTRPAGAPVHYNSRGSGPTLITFLFDLPFMLLA